MINALHCNVVTKFHQVVFIKSLGSNTSPGVGGLDADEGAGDDLDVAKEGGHPNYYYLVIFVVKMVTFLVVSMLIK